MRKGLRLAVAALLALSSAVTGAHAAQQSPPRSHLATPIVANGSWTQYHRDAGRTGYDPAAPAITAVQPTPGWQLNVLDGEVYAEPLIYGGIVYAATLNDTVYALNQIDGSVIWSKNVGAPQTSGWVCSSLTPGILSTPIIDTAANRIYVVAELAAVGVTPPTYHLFGLDLGNSGNIVLNTPIAPTGFDWKIEQQRGALGLANNNVYIPIGGRAGDCSDGATPYHGYVVAAPINGGAISWYATPGDGDGIWAAGGVTIDTTNGHVFAATGNGNCNSATYMYDDAVLGFYKPDLSDSPLSFFSPPDHNANWSCNDADLGSASPLLISPNLIFQSGKWGTGFLINPSSLGGVGGELYPPSSPTYNEVNTCMGQHSDATFGSFAYAAPYVYLECESPTTGRGLTALNVTTTAPVSFNACNSPCAAPDWNVGGSLRFGPPVVAGGAVWVASDNNGLYAYNQTTGALIYQSAGFGINRFVTPSEAGGQVFVPSHSVIRSFSFTNGGTVTVTPGSVSFNGQAPGTTSAAQTATLHNNTTSTVNVSSVAFAGANAGNYIKGTDTCTGAAVTSGSTCTVQVSFRPASFGGLPATVSFTDNGPASPQTIPLYGMGALDNQGHLYSLDGYGGIHSAGTAPAMAGSAYWSGWNIARSIALFPDGQGGYVMDGYGGLHPFGNAPAVSGAYWLGWDIARQVVLAPWSSHTNPAGWTLDGWGGLHPFGGAPTINGISGWPGWDIARGVAILPDSAPSAVAGYQLEGYGGVHAFGGAPAISNEAAWPGWDIARGITLSPDATINNPSGWTLDGYGGVHPFGTAPAIPNFAYWGWDIARGIVSWSGSPNGGWVLEGFGGIHPFGTAPSVSPFAYWPNWDIAVGLGGSGVSTASRRRT